MYVSYIGATCASVPKAHLNGIKKKKLVTCLHRDISLVPF